MDVAARWQKEWAGAAEFGKVTEGGVTRQVSRAVEVLNASAPGTRVRVMRAAYHSSSGPGIPASTFMLHSSRRVISSGTKILESPTSPCKPLEISSTPLESSPDFDDPKNYKVTEPDDSEISAPSTWRASNGTGSFRMPSEESSSIDNASVIDLDTYTNNDNKPFRKKSYDSDYNDSSHVKISLRNSPLLSSPESLSTLKYKSLLNGSNDWNSRRKSYSFENTPPHTPLHSNDAFTMESSTDSGICKSTELFNDDITKFQSETYNNNESVKSKITVQSPGKVIITVPIELETDEQYMNDNNIRRVKKVGFSKTELHFAAESGKVNIIATDAKPPPSYDFRKRRSAFVPINEKFDKPITLFGSSEVEMTCFAQNNEEADKIEFDENTATTKSILKNKIPKPKPYLLGENMMFGEKMDSKKGDSEDSAVSLINKRLKAEESILWNNDKFVRTYDEGPREIVANNRLSHKTQEATDVQPIKYKLHSIHLSPTYGRSKTRQLRDSDLTYFGINNDISTKPKSYRDRSLPRERTSAEFESVRLIQQISSTLGNSEIESEAAEYENIRSNPKKITNLQYSADYADKPDKHVDNYYSKLQTEQVDLSKNVNAPRRYRLRKPSDSLGSNSSRSLSEPRKNHKATNIIESYEFKKPVSPRFSKQIKENSERNKIYVNIEIQDPLTNMNAKKNATVSNSKMKQPTIRVDKTKEGYDLNATKNKNKQCDANYIGKKDNRTRILSTPESKQEKYKVSSRKAKTSNVISHNNDNIENMRKRSPQSSSTNSNEWNNKSNIMLKDSRKPKLVEIPQDTDIQTEIGKNKNEDNELSGKRNRITRPRDTPRGNSKDISRTSGRSKYVINYDEKHGTVSSICKLKPVHENTSCARKDKHNSIDNKPKKSTTRIQSAAARRSTNGLNTIYFNIRKSRYRNKNCTLL